MMNGLTSRRRRMYLERLRKVVELLKRLPKKRFDYNMWVGADWKGDPTLSCGTTACALGWATTIPSLRRAGLVLRRRYGYGYVAMHRQRRDDPFSSGLHGTLDISLSAACTVFGLDRVEAYRLFADKGLLDCNAAPRDVAKHLQRFIARGGQL